MSGLLEIEEAGEEENMGGVLAFVCQLWFEQRIIKEEIK